MLQRDHTDHLLMCYYSPVELILVSFVLLPVQWDVYTDAYDRQPLAVQRTRQPRGLSDLNITIDNSTV